MFGQSADSLVVSPMVIDTTPPAIDSAKYRLQSERPAESFGGGPTPKGISSQLTSDQSQADAGRPQTGTATIGGDPLKYGAKDSSFLDIVNQELHLYGEAFVTFQEFEVKADYILLDLTTNEVKAARRSKSTPKTTFSSGEQNVSAEEIRFNIDSQKGIVYGANIIQNNLYVHGATTKFVRSGDDSLHIEDVIYNRNALITTCDHEHPHWGIRTSKLKFIPDRLAVIGPSNIELAGVPTPLVMPFAFAPLMNFNNAASGLIFPTDPFYQSPDLGLGVRGLGYYFALSEYADLSVRTDLYTRGSWAITTNTNYKKRYKYTGAVNLSFSKQLRNVAGQIEPNVQNSYSITINHNQDSKAHPFRTVGGSLRFTVNDYDRRNYQDAQSQLNSQINSNFSYNYKLSDVWNFSTAISHSQNTLNRSINFTLPDVKLRMKRIFPFKRKQSINDEKWYEKINMQYSGQMQNKVSTVDTLLFTQETLESFRAGVTHQIDAGASYNLFDYFTFNTTANYDEFWYMQTHELGRDSLGQIDSEVVSGFKPLREMSIGANVTTNIFGTIQFKKGWLRGLRHQIRPSVGLSYRPSTEGYYEYFDLDPNSAIDELVRYNPFSPDNPFDNTDNETLYTNNSLNQGGMSINYSLNNTFEGKYYSKKDSSEKKFKIFNSVNLGGNYNLQADSLNWSTISLSANANILKNVSTLSISGTLDPYNEVSTGGSGRRINTTMWASDKKLFRLDALTLNLSTRFTLEDLRDWLVYGGEAPKTNNARNPRSKNEHPELFSWFEGARIQHIFRLAYKSDGDDRSWEVGTHSIQLTTGNIPLTDKWGMSVGNLSYDIKNKRWVYPSFTLNRDLHCWQMSISWQPQADTYSFFIGVKAAPFSDFLKYQSGRTAFDASFIR